MKEIKNVCDVSHCYLCSHCSADWAMAIASHKKNYEVKKGQQIFAEGDTVASVARAYRTRPQAIEAQNHLQDGDELKADTKLIIPIPPGKHAATEDGASYARAATRYKVRR